MNGVHDMGGQHCHGPIVDADDNVKFHQEWERDVLALSLAMGATGTWNLDESRATRESLPPAYYLDAGYYTIWLTALEQLLVRYKLVTLQELEQGKAIEPPSRLNRILRADQVESALATGSPVERRTETQPRFSAGERVRVRQLHRRSHTRLPGYIRGHSGVIERVHGCHVFPDTHAIGQGEQPQWLYNVSFDSQTLWGPEKVNGGKVHVDCWEPYLTSLADSQSSYV